MSRFQNFNGNRVVRLADLGKYGTYPFWVASAKDSRNESLPVMPSTKLSRSDDRRRAVSRHTLSYMLCSISELFRHYDFDPLDLLVVHAVLNANVVQIMKSPELDERYKSIEAVEPDTIKQGISRAALSRFLNLPLETVRRRVDRLKRRRILLEGSEGLIVSESNKHKFGNNHELQSVNMVLVKKLLRDLRQAGVSGPDDL